MPGYPRIHEEIRVDGRDNPSHDVGKSVVCIIDSRNAFQGHHLEHQLGPAAH
jgi:hypothetical protein